MSECRSVTRFGKMSSVAEKQRGIRRLEGLFVPSDLELRSAYGYLLEIARRYWDVARVEISAFAAEKSAPYYRAIGCFVGVCSTWTSRTDITIWSLLGT